ncbi:hypothetical protein CWI36_0071p0060 [Hamiltosporidium magnivora]|uniref:Uncharacterized protein n=1 Tax=Hamiltosporidium magnivora TaxID=148818 RepID=A0A4Q9LND3_9MICR|nr:hypothetical protein CWI36_0071p0060 [Hamiltosporidium magnivora]
MFFLFKKPKNLEFVEEEYKPNDTSIRGLQVRWRNTQSNTKLIKYKDGTMSLKVGTDIFPITCTHLPNKIYFLNEKNDSYQMVTHVNEKHQCFMHKKN